MAKKKLSNKTQGLIALAGAAAIGVLLLRRKKSNTYGIGTVEEYNPKKVFFDIISKKVNLSWYDSIMVFERGKRLVVIVAQRENLGGSAHYYQQNEITINIATLYKKEIFADDLTTNGFVWIYEYFKNK